MIEEGRAKTALEAIEGQRKFRGRSWMSETGRLAPWQPLRRNALPWAG
jgi:hypothetical protein